MPAHEADGSMRWAGSMAIYCPSSPPTARMAVSPGDSSATGFLFCAFTVGMPEHVGYKVHVVAA